MREYVRSELLKRCNAEIEHQILTVNSLFSIQKSEDVLITAPLPGKWSAKQCMEHLNATLDLYLPRIESALERQMHDSQENLKHGFVGYKLFSNMLPEKGIKMKTSKTFKSLKPGISGKPSLAVVMEFALNMKRLKVCLESSAHVNIQKTKVASAAGSLLKLRLGDVYPFLLNHNRRHIIQAERAIELSLKHK